MTIQTIDQRIKNLDQNDIELNNSQILNIEECSLG